MVYVKRGGLRGWVNMMCVNMVCDNRVHVERVG